MKKKFLIFTFVVAVAAAAGWNFSQNHNETLSDMALDNIEALADETITPPPICNKKFYTTPTDTCCDVVKHCVPDGNSCC
ncbi:MAG: NVEALA domain-containing protein [Dysgonamonadaceae bacterium]|nr:NVEALA domain-containing protein [Dysgonamonadaceae bacterium]